MHLSFALATLLPCIIIVFAAPFEGQGFGEGGFLIRRFNYMPDLPVRDLIPNVINPATQGEIGVTPSIEVEDAIVATQLHSGPIGNQLSPRNEDGAVLVQVRHIDDVLGGQVRRNEDGSVLVQVRHIDDVLGGQVRRNEKGLGA